MEEEEEEERWRERKQDATDRASGECRFSDCFRRTGGGVRQRSLALHKNPWTHCSAHLGARVNTHGERRRSHICKGTVHGLSGVEASPASCEAPLPAPSSTSATTYYLCRAPSYLLWPTDWELYLPPPSSSITVSNRSSFPPVPFTRLDVATRVSSVDLELDLEAEEARRGKVSEDDKVFH